MRINWIFIVSFSILSGQARIGDWNSFTSPLNIHEIIEYEESLVCATDGGLLIFDTINQSFENLNNIDELSSSKLKCLAIGESGELWLGGGESNGFVQIYNVNSQQSIKKFDYNMSEIIDFAISDEIVYAVYRDKNDYGIIEINLLNSEYSHKDIYPNWPRGEKIYNIEIYNNSVYVATEIGLYKGNIGDDPNNWERPFIELENSVSSLFLQKYKLYCYSDNALFLIDLNDLQLSNIRSLLEYPLKDFTVLSDGTIIGVSERKIYYFKDNIINEIAIPKNSVNSINLLNDDSVVFGTTTGLAFIHDGQTINYLIPNAPLTNNFQAITILEDGRIVCGSNIGIAIKETGGWRNIVESEEDVIIQTDKDYNYFIADSIPVDFGASISRLAQGPDGLLYCAIEGTYPYPRRNGGGIIIIDVDNPANFTLIDTTYLDYFANEYLIIKDIEFDRDGNLWVADAFATTKHEPLHVKTVDGIWKSFNAEDASGAIGLTPSAVAIDAWKRVWVGSFQDGERNIGFPDGGLAMLSYSGDPAQPDEFQWHQININSVSLNKTIWSIAITPENRLYMLTPNGLTYFDLQFSNDDPIKYESPRYYFPNISFGQESEVRLDANGNAWTVSGSDGIHVLLSNSTFWPDDNENIVVESINTENYPLLSNNVTAIVFDDDNGIAYISTNRGINSFRIPFATSKKNYSELKIFPSPFHIPSDKPLIIDNLKDKSSLKVMTITGEVIRSLNTSGLGRHGYQIQWDGKDENGKWVGSGVYLLAVHTTDGSHDFGKVVVIRH
jgi:ligand-binding sensor domain-containing protein